MGATLHRTVKSLQICACPGPHSGARLLEHVSDPEERRLCAPRARLCAFALFMALSPGLSALARLGGPLPGSVCPVWNPSLWMACPQYGLRAPTQLYSPAPMRDTPASQRSPLAESSCLPCTFLKLIHHLDLEAALLTRAPLLLTGAPRLALHAGAQVLTEAQVDLGGRGGGQPGTVLGGRCQAHSRNLTPLGSPRGMRSPRPHPARLASPQSS